jgi:hypothetical protein
LPSAPGPLGVGEVRVLQVLVERRVGRAGVGLGELQVDDLTPQAQRAAIVHRHRAAEVLQRLCRSAQGFEALAEPAVQIAVGLDALGERDARLLDDPLVVDVEVDLRLLLRRLDRLREHQVDPRLVLADELLAVQQLVEVFDRGGRALVAQEGAGDVDLLVDREARLGVDEKVGGVAEEAERDEQQRQLPEVGDSSLRGGA